MNIEEILANAKREQELIRKGFREIFANTERDQELIRVLTHALERMNANFARLLAGKPVRDASKTIAEVEYALAKARERQ